MVFIDSIRICVLVFGIGGIGVVIWAFFACIKDKLKEKYPEDETLYRILFPFWLAYVLCLIVVLAAYIVLVIYGIDHFPNQIEVS